MTRDAQSVLALIEQMRAHRGDFTGVEVKRGSGGTPDVAKTLCAFGNSPEGGLLILGLDEQAGFAVTGVMDLAVLEQAIASQARQAVVPPVMVTFENVMLADKQIVVAEVQGLSAHQRPCRTGGRAYLRQADGDYPMSMAEEQLLLAMRDRPRCDAQPVEGTTIAELDPHLVSEFVPAVRASSRRLRDVDEETLLRRRGILEPGGKRLTLAGLYALGEYPQQFMPNLAVTAAVVTAPGSVDRLVDLVHLDGPIPDLLETSMEWVRRNLRVGVRVGADGNNYDHPELPLGAVRELIANALVHRDLGPHTQTKRVEIRLLPDRLVITSPGGLWGVSREQLGTAAGKSAVNEHLYGVCSHLTTSRGARVIEGEGGGISEVQRALSVWHADPPIFMDRVVSFTAVLMRPNAVLRQTATDLRATPEDPQARILAALAAGPLDRASIGERTGLTKAQTRYALERLIARERVIMKGGLGARNTTYALTHERAGHDENADERST